MPCAVGAKPAMDRDSHHAARSESLPMIADLRHVNGEAQSKSGGSTVMAYGNMSALSGLSNVSLALTPPCDHRSLDMTMTMAMSLSYADFVACVVLL